MKKAVIVLLIVGAALIALGGIAAGVSFLLLKGDFASFDLGKEINETYRPQEEFSSIEMDVRHNVTFVLSSDGNCRVDYTGEDRGKREVKVENGRLLITERYDEPSFFVFYFKESLFTVYLPKSGYESLRLKGSTGDLKVPGDFTFENASVALTTGDVKFDASVDGALEVTASTGDFSTDGGRFGALSVVTTTGDQFYRSAKAEGDVALEASTGEIRMSDLTCPSLKIKLTTGNAELTDVLSNGKMEIEASTGDVRLKRCDAGDIDIKVSTGSVTGSLRSAKTFDAHASTGRVDVPSDGGSGTCKVRTSTGSIRLEIEET